MKKNSSKSIIAKIIVPLLLLIVILYSVKNVSLSILGEETTGYITSTSQRNDRDSRSSSNRYRNTVSYYFELDDKKYEGNVSYRTNMPIVRKQNQEVVETTVQYLKIIPSINTLAKYNEGTVISYIMRFGLIIICIILILTIFGVKMFKKSDSI